MKLDLNWSFCLSQKNILRDYKLYFAEHVDCSIFYRLTVESFAITFVQLEGCWKLNLTPKDLKSCNNKTESNSDKRTLVFSVQAQVDQTLAVRCCLELQPDIWILTITIYCLPRKLFAYTIQACHKLWAVAIVWKQTRLSGSGFCRHNLSS